MLVIRNFLTSALRFRRERKGSAAIEFAMLSVPFFLIVFTILEIALLFTAELSLDKATAVAGRTLRLARLQEKDINKAELVALTCTKTMFMFDCSKLTFDLQSYTSFDEVPEVPTKTIVTPCDTIKKMMGSPAQKKKGGVIVALRVSYKWPMITGLARQFFARDGDGETVLMSMSTFRTEPS